MLPFKVVYHPRYDLNLGAHVFPSQKFRWIAEELLSSGIAGPGDFLTPQPASDEDLLRVHTSSWVNKLKTGSLSASEIMKLEVPYSPELAEAVWLAAGGTILAAQSALRDGFGSNLSGGFHHAYANHGEGFCAIHDVAVALRRLQSDGDIKKAMIVDTDVHHGNGTAAIFTGDSSVFTISIHQVNNYPADKPPSTVDLNMRDGAGDDEYLAALIPTVERCLDKFEPDMIFYVGGADPYSEDQLGGLLLTKAGLKRRDREVFEAARSRSIPVTTALAGGYARRVEDTVAIHVNTIIAAREVAEKYPQSTERKSQGAGS
ncbi:MAG TPA: histone deacetylase [Methylomirabilota bacterium]|jgi:acetoin utilization deacetylase AcuC-like enzyme|nr:histone deacetylase [Methylomirabilota bacterium]